MNNADKPAFAAMAANPVGVRTQEGLTKREYFAAMAMHGFLASYAGADAIPKAESVATSSVYYADALLNELSKPTTK